MGHRHRVMIAAGVMLAATACGTAKAQRTPPSTTTVASTTTTVIAKGPTVELLAAGDIADCKSDADAKTAALVAASTAPVAELGDLAYENGSTTDFANCWKPTWGAFDTRAHPVPGNHEYQTKNAAPYFAHFGTKAGTAGQGWYSYDLGAWHIVALNSNCDSVGGCTAESPQGRWLQADLAAHRTRCTLAYWHHPRFSSGIHGETETMQPFWQLLADARTDIVLSGHDHHYERFAPKDGAGSDAATGLRQFVVGTGGRTLYPTLIPAPGSEVRNSDTFGVLSLSLNPAGYSWEFRPVAGSTFTDRGSATCA